MIRFLLNRKMKLKAYQSVPNFFKDNLEFLERQEAANNLIIGIPTAMQRFPYDEKKLRLLNIFDKNKVIISIAQTPPRNLLMYCEQRAVKHFDKLIDFLIHNNFEVNGVVGPFHEMVEFADHWNAFTGQRWQFNFKQKAYQLNQLIDVPISKGSFRKAVSEDLELVASWFKAFLIEALGGEELDHAEAIAESKIENEEVYLWENNGIVAMACSARPTRNCVTINYVYTPKNLRGNGYASSVTHHLSELLLKSYKHCALFTDLANPTSNSIYQKMGYREVARWCTIDFV